MQLVIEPDGTLLCIYGEAIDLGSLGVLAIRRASYVELDQQGE